MKTIFKILFLACVVFAFGILLYSPVCAGFKQSLYGIVLDAETGQPLEDVNVYIANSMLGAATDEKGRFVLLDVPLGTYELIVQMLGYEVQKARIRLTGPREEIYVFRLTPQIIPMPEVLVSARDQEQWRHNLEKFKELFIGTTRNASQCKLLNPYVLDFSITDEGIFKAVANQPLLIKNGALGYKLHIVLENFAYRPPKTGNYFVDYPVGGSGVKQIKERPSLLRYAGFPRFEALPPEYPGQEKVWKKNRQRAYRGSLRHFLRTLCRYYDRAVKSDTVEYPLYEGE
ncbi:hypothetical protein GWN26_08310, partial [Candidatus Saccharibacteria bacterium]|nr:hypothetical protein [Calditrichia bacterium]NIV99137.1 hypothetical protein [Candidatus Saccharibacteria bacterium]NIW79646.1 hypothetical protein [Calditrichia bacterium]